MRGKLFLLFFLSFSVLNAQVNVTILQQKLDSLRNAGGYPGISVSIVDRNQQSYIIQSGYSDRDRQTPLKTSDMFMQGSVGKTYVSAIAVKLIQQKKLNLDDKVSKYLGHLDWYKRIPNAESITIAQIMNHTSGVMRYEFKPTFTTDLSNNPTKSWKPEELLSYILNEKASFAAGEGWEYSDTNYILLGMIIEQITGKKFYDVAQKDLLDHFKLKNTRPTNQMKLPGLVQGYAGDANEFGHKDKVIDENGLFIINPQFEWTGGGMYSTTTDLARWGWLLYTNKVVDTSLLFSHAANAKLGKNSKYALGVIIRETPDGPAYGHSGFFPGYLTEMFYFPSKQLVIAVQANSSDFKKIKLSLARIMMELEKTI